MVKAQEFVVSLVEKSGDSYDVVEEKSKVSKATISRMMRGLTVNGTSLRLIADAYGQLNELQALFTASALPQRAADELIESYDKAERILTEAYEDRIRSMSATIKAQQDEIRQIRIQHDKVMERMELAHDKERTSAEQHFDRERDALEKALQQAEIELQQGRRVNLRAFAALGIEGMLLLLALIALILR